MKMDHLEIAALVRDGLVTEENLYTIAWAQPCKDGEYNEVEQALFNAVAADDKYGREVEGASRMLNTWDGNPETWESTVEDWLGYLNSWRDADDTCWDDEH